MKYTLIFSFENTINKKAHIIFSNNENLLKHGNDCEILYKTDFDNSKEIKNDAKRPFILVKFRQLLLAGYITYNHEERFDFFLEIINFDEVFNPIPTYLHYFATKKFGFGEMFCKTNFDLSDIYPEMLNNYIFKQVPEDYMEYIEFTRLADLEINTNSEPFEDKGNDYIQEEIL